MTNEERWNRTIEWHTASRVGRAIHRAPVFRIGVETGDVRLAGILRPQSRGRGLIIVAHGDCNRTRRLRGLWFAQTLSDAGFTTLAVDLFTLPELSAIRRTGSPQRDIGLLAARLAAVTDWMLGEAAIGDVPVGYCCEGVTAAAAAIAAAAFGPRIRAIALRDPQTDLARPFFRFVKAPTRAIIGLGDVLAVERGREALRLISAESDVVDVRREEEPDQPYGDIDRVARALREWFERHVGRTSWFVGGSHLN